jgi:hypothetical protein
MTAGAFGLTMVGTVLALGAIPGWFARDRHALFATDVALVVVPPVSFFLAGDLLNDGLHMGIGLVVYPFLVLVACVVLFSARVIVLDRFTNPRRSSVICLVGMAIAAFVLGIVIPPLYE